MRWSVLGLVVAGYSSFLDPDPTGLVASLPRPNSPTELGDLQPKTFDRKNEIGLIFLLKVKILLETWPSLQGARELARKLFKQL